MRRKVESSWSASTIETVTHTDHHGQISTIQRLVKTLSTLQVNFINLSKSSMMFSRDMPCSTLTMLCHLSTYSTLSTKDLEDASSSRKVLLDQVFTIVYRYRAWEGHQGRYMGLNSCCYRRLGTEESQIQSDLNCLLEDDQHKCIIRQSRDRWQPH